MCRHTPLQVSVWASGRFLRIQKGERKANPPFNCVSRPIQRDLGGGSSIYTPQPFSSLYGPLKRKYEGVGGLVKAQEVRINPRRARDPPVKRLKAHAALNSRVGQARGNVAARNVGTPSF